MSTPRLDLSGVDFGAEGDPFGSGLIARLANDAYFGRVEETAFLPSFVPPGFPALKESSPSGDLETIELSRGFPATESGPPPVHPNVVSVDPEPTETKPVEPEAYTGEGEAGAYEFGEPRSIFAEERRSGFKGEEPTDGLLANLDPSAAPGAESFYFLKGLPGAETPAATAQSGSALAGSRPVFDIEGARAEFPALHQLVNGKPLVWLDNAATTHKPQAVIDATSRFYSRDNSNIHRAAHTLAERSTELFEGGREKTRQFLGAADAKEIVFVRGTTEGINLVAQTYGRKHVGAGDEILVTELEHHANIVPWQLLAEQTGASLRHIPIDDRGELILEALPKLLSEKTKIVSVAHVSNALGTVNPLEEIIAQAHALGIPVVVDGAQSTPHLPVNVQALDADFYVFSGHKVFAPTGIGAVYGKAALWESLPPWQGGGHMIRDVTFERTVYQNPPERFEAGTPDIAGVVGLGAAIDFLFRLGIPAIAAYEHALLEYGTEALSSIRGIRPIGTAPNKASVMGFVIPGVSNESIAKHLDRHGIAVRAGHHCAMPALRHFGLESTVRPSVAFYNTTEEIDTLVRALHSLPRH